MDLRKETNIEGGQEMGLGLMMLAAALIIAVLFHGLVICRFDTTQSFDDVTYLDSFTAEDSVLMLQRGPSGRLQLLEYQKNWILPRYSLRSVHDVEDGFTTAIETTFVAYPVSVEGETIAIGEQDVGLRWSMFISAYGVWMLFPMIAQYTLYRKWKEKN